MPIYEFECERCGARFEELVRVGQTAPCPRCRSSNVKRRPSQIGEPRVPVGLSGREAKRSDATRRDREEKRQEGFRRDRERRRQRG